MMRSILSLIILALLSACGAGANSGPSGPLTWYEARWEGVHPQELDNSCGIASLITILNSHFGEQYTEPELITEYFTIASEAEIAEAMGKGISRDELRLLAEHIGYEARGLTLTYDALQSAVQNLPALVYVEIGRLKHFVVVRGASQSEVWVADPSVGNSIYSTEEFLAMWKGQTALFVAKDVATIDQAFLAAPPGVQPSLTEMRRSMILGGN